MEAHSHIEAIANIGLAGDRYALGKGYYSGQKNWDAQITLIQQEPFDDLLKNHDLVIDPKLLRRNLLTLGVELRSLIGKEFRIGANVILRARKPWPLCHHVLQLARDVDLFKHLSKHGGIGADVLTTGIIHVSDTITI